MKGHNQNLRTLRSGIKQNKNILTETYKEIKKKKIDKCFVKHFQKFEKRGSMISSVVPYDKYDLHGPYSFSKSSMVPYHTYIGGYIILIIYILGINVSNTGRNRINN